MPLKTQVLEKLRHAGVDIMKSPGRSYRPLPVFTMAVERLMQRRGEALHFIQVGANDGIYSDPLRRYVLANGWAGILVEPQRDVFDCLVANYAQIGDRLIFENCAIGQSGTELVLYRAPTTIQPGEVMMRTLTVTSSSADVVARQTGIAAKDLDKISVPCLTLDDLIEKHAFHKLDVLQIDVEGFDLEVLKTISLDRWRPGVIQFEHGHLNRAQLAEVGRLLTKNDYLLYYGGRDFGDSVAMPKEEF